METAFDGGNAEWEITRYAGARHGYTSFTSGAYNIVADARSWDSMLEFFQEKVSVPDITDSPTMAPTFPEEPAGDTTAASGVVGMMTALVACISALFFF
jgi:hypothetical protein